MARGLLARILAFGRERGFWQPSDHLADPFGGVGTTAILGTYEGYRVTVVELEPRFAQFCRDNFALHRARWGRLGVTPPTVIHGDSRRFAGLLRGVAGVVTSPPYADAGGTPSLGSVGKDDWGREGKDIAGRRGLSAEYGDTPGQIGRLSAGADGVVTSPPWEDVTNERVGRKTPLDPRKSSCPQNRSAESVARLEADYGNSPGQLGQEKGETYWQAVHAVYAQCRLALRPGGVLAVVVKDYVRDGVRVPLCDQTAALLDAVGFQVFLRCHALLTKEWDEPDLFAGSVRRKKSRVSFFRRLAEKKGAPPITHEDVIWARKP